MRRLVVVFGRRLCQHNHIKAGDCTREILCTSLVFIVVWLLIVACFSPPSPPTRTNNCLVSWLRPLCCSGSNCAQQASNLDEGFIDSMNRVPLQAHVGLIHGRSTAAPRHPKQPKACGRVWDGLRVGWQRWGEFGHGGGGVSSN